MRLRVIVALASASLACGHAIRPPVGTAAAEPRDARGRKGADLDAMCAARLPACPHPHPVPARPDPCAGRGARCMEQRRLDAEDWTCACDACRSDDECAAGERCAASWRGCPPRLVERACVPAASGEPECPPELLLAPPSAGR